MQWGDKELGTERLKILEWQFLSRQPQKTITTRPEMFAQLIMKGRNRIVELSGKEPETIIIPMTEQYLQWCLQNSQLLQIALAAFSGQVKVQHPSHRPITFTEQQCLEQKSKCSATPVNGPTVFTDGSGKTVKAALTWLENGQWKSHVVILQASPQIVGLRAIIAVFKNG